MYGRRKIYLRLFLVVICIWMLFFLSEISKNKRLFNFFYTTKRTRRNNTPQDTKLMIEGIQNVIARYTDVFFLIEPSILEAIVNKSADNTAFYTLHVVTFGIIGSHNETWKPFCENMKSQGFSANYSTDILNREVKPMQSATTHILIRHNIFIHPVIHIVVFYRKQESYLWHSQLLLPEPTLTFAKKAGIYESFFTEAHHLDGIRVLTPSPVSLFLHEMKESEFIECNCSRAEKFYEKYPKDPNDKEGAHIQREGKLGLATFSKVFARLGIPFTLSCGSLLGWFRQCDILPYGDVDIEMFITDYTPTIIEALTDASMQLTNIYGRINDSYELSFVSPGNVRFDIFMVYVEENSFWLASVYPDDGAKYKYTFPKYTRCWTTLTDILVRVPCNTEQYILAFNGKNWTIPLREGYDMPNVKLNGYWPRDQWKEVMQSFY